MSLRSWSWIPFVGWAALQDSYCLTSRIEILPDIPRGMLSAKRLSGQTTGLSLLGTLVSPARSTRLWRTYSGYPNERNHSRQCGVSSPGFGHGLRRLRRHPLLEFFAANIRNPHTRRASACFRTSQAMTDFVSYALPAPSFMAGRFEVVARRPI